MVNASFLGRYGWLLVPFAGLSAALALCFFPLHLKLSSVIPVAIASLATFGAWQFYRLKRPDPGISALAESATFLLVIMPLLAILNYATTMAARPLLDENFARMDALMGFDWMAHLAWVKAWPGLGTVLTVAYGSTLPQVVAAIIILAYCHRMRDLREFIMLFVMTLTVTLLLSAIFPASGAYAYFAPPADMAVGFDPRNGIWHLAQLTGLRNGTMTTLDLSHTEGLVTFPSFHTILAILTTWAVREVRYLALPVALLNVLVVLSTLSIGGHHLVDVVAGALIAVTGIAAFRYRVLSRHAGAQRAATPA
jgi:membrane-associated phospholipid phosphatase